MKKNRMKNLKRTKIKLTMRKWRRRRMWRMCTPKEGQYQQDEMVPLILSALHVLYNLLHYAASLTLPEAK